VNRHARSALARSPAPHGRVLARGQLPQRRADLPARQPAVARAAALRGREAAPARPLGDDAGAELRVRARQPGHRRARSRRHLRDGPGARRARHRRQHVPRGVQRGVPERLAGRAGDGAALSPVLVPRRHPEPRRARDARQHPRGRRARLRPEPRVRRGLRQPGPRRLLRRRRRRGGDGAAGDELALEQVPEPGRGRRGRADPAPQRLQDRRFDGAGAHPRGGATPVAVGLRVGAALRRGGRPGRDAPEDGRDDGRRRRRHPAHPEGGARAASSGDRAGR
jgi:hypothetical protein